jgi:phage terminase large subunit-like protein
MSPRKRAEVLGKLSDAEAEAILRDWPLWARAEQMAPPGDWSTWVINAGRGFGKTRSGLEWVRGEIESGRRRRFALIAADTKDARDVLVEGPSGLLNISPSWATPIYESTKRLLTWPCGATAHIYSAEDPEELRGPQFDGFAADEFAKWRYAQETWDMLQFGLREGRDPRGVVMTTPKPTVAYRSLLAEPTTVVTRGKTIDNRQNLSAKFITKITSQYDGTRLGRQELDGELLADTPGALWMRSQIDRDRVRAAPELVRIVVAVDPPVTSGEDADECGIVVAGKGVDGVCYVLADHSAQGLTPQQWAARVIAAYSSHRADVIVAEVNQGGELVAGVIRQVDPAAPIKTIHAKRGKALRAEPVSLLYEQGRVRHVGALPQLEDQMCMFTADFDKRVAGYSPDRVDAVVYAVSELMLVADTRPAIRTL